LSLADFIARLAFFAIAPFAIVLAAEPLSGARRARRRGPSAVRVHPRRSAAPLRFALSPRSATCSKRPSPSRTYYRAETATPLPLLLGVSVPVPVLAVEPRSARRVLDVPWLHAGKLLGFGGRPSLAIFFEIGRPSSAFEISCPRCSSRSASRQLLVLSLLMPIRDDGGLVPLELSPPSAARDAARRCPVHRICADARAQSSRVPSCLTSPNSGCGCALRQRARARTERCLARWRSRWRDLVKVRGVDGDGKGRRQSARRRARAALEDVLQARRSFRLRSLGEPTQSSARCSCSMRRVGANNPPSGSP